MKSGEVLAARPEVSRSACAAGSRPRHRAAEVAERHPGAAAEGQVEDQHHGAQRAEHRLHRGRQPQVAAADGADEMRDHPLRLPPLQPVEQAARGDDRGVLVGGARRKRHSAPAHQPAAGAASAGRRPRRARRGCCRVAALPGRPRTAPGRRGRRRPRRWRCGGGSAPAGPRPGRRRACRAAPAAPRAGSGGRRPGRRPGPARRGCRDPGEGRDAAADPAVQPAAPPASPPVPGRARPAASGRAPAAAGPAAR